MFLQPHPVPRSPFCQRHSPGFTLWFWIIIMFKFCLRAWGSGWNTLDEIWSAQWVPPRKNTLVCFGSTIFMSVYVCLFPGADRFAFRHFGVGATGHRFLSDRANAQMSGKDGDIASSWTYLWKRDLWLLMTLRKSICLRCRQSNWSPGG